MTQEAILALEDGSLFRGIAIGAAGKASGEVVFNTSMTGYQEILTDPSYAQQIVTLTYPHIGNIGINDEDNESGAVWASGLVIRNLPLLASNWRMEQTLGEFLRQRKVVAIAEVDTRRLTRLLRDKGPMNGAIVTGKELAAIGEEGAVALARGFPGLKGMDLAKVVSSSKRYAWEEGEWALGQSQGASDESRHRVVAYDFGVKRNILRMLVARGCEVTVVPAQTPASEVMAMNPSGVFLSNGPGDPEPCNYAISAIKEFLEANMPLFGICLGCQLLALACGANTIKMRLGHHGANHPVQNLGDGTVMITSQNHGFAVDEQTLPANLRATHKSLFDGSLQGIERTDKPAFGFQGHPEASPGPHDVAPLFDHFIELMDASIGNQPLDKEAS
ncbi:MAG TPA: carbamoyl-phosphate synthase small subunit [Gammaproteobacteria bacterium]|uniref:Carbamoyl phosphate synthase small chain n=1 Tax=OM182 bacterium TaxID=2510334 RepID=A0A520S119_9GAMM|nr:carbamoyl-phosphate synthase small subunit [Gammaproteobacteria bacterium]RPG43857.1 MAG: carbamoyl-phosphate synthase small subunit [Gammaproteobacteria bacterium TMED163]RZO76156.1 MAG: carbamoyl-phosphate synthase small subunit [OM182 bacterium]HAR91061.1 carbamoyl-phosphate synthase small subunit [Gammaproteobacteria bacterium]HAU23355.1 carbamoyl-phosphate synthase small subunit [Gammaproteobacteria bacterium]